MSTFLKLSWRNIWRNRRRTLITIAAIVFAVIMSAVMRSIQYGSYDAMESLSIRLLHGDLQIHRKGYQQEQTLKYYLEQDEVDWQELVEGNPALEGFSRRLSGFGLVSSDSGSTGALILGIEPERELEMTRFAGMVRQGERLQAGDDRHVLIGEAMANNLRLGIGDSLVILTQGFRNAMGADLYVIKGLTGMGASEFDQRILILPLHNAQELFSHPNGVTQVVLRTDDYKKAVGIARNLEQRLDAERYEVMAWDELMPELKQAIVMDNVSGAIYLAFLLIVVGMEILNATTMSIIERTREFGILQSIGMRPGQVGKIILLESTLKLTVALVVGLVLAALLLAVLVDHPIPLPPEIAEAYADFGFGLDELAFSAKPRVFLEPLLATLFIGILALIYPLVRTMRLEPIEAFRRV